jgi:hemoglobin-like flavoprotein
MENHVDVFRASLKRCLASDDFLRQFYHRLLASSEEVRRKFENTDLDRQARILEDSLYIITVAAQSAQPSEEVSPAWTEMSRLARLHDRDHLDIRPGLYDLWLHCLLEAARAHDPEFTPEIEEDWRKTLEIGIEYLRSHHEPGLPAE